MKLLRRKTPRVAVVAKPVAKPIEKGLFVVVDFDGTRLTPAMTKAEAQSELIWLQHQYRSGSHLMNVEWQEFPTFATMRK